MDCQPWIDKYKVCAAVFGMHVAVCASARVCPLLGVLLPSQQEAEYSFSGFIPTNKAKKTKKLLRRLFKGNPPKGALKEECWERGNPGPVVPYHP